MICGADSCGITSDTTGLIIMELGGTVTPPDDHDHSEYEVTTGLVCGNCGENETACAMCGISLHKCAQVEVRDPRIPPGFRKIEEFPDYMVSKQATVKYIPTGKLCLLVRVSNTGGAMINLMRDGKKYTRAAQDLRDKTFGMNGEENGKHSS